MKYEVEVTSKFKKDYKIAMKRGLKIELLDNVIKLLANGEKLPEENKDHNLAGNYKGYRECHIQPDWLLVYKISDNTLILSLSRTGSHSDLFRTKQKYV